MSSTNPMACLQMMPWFIKKDIIENLDTESRLHMRAVSSDFLSYVDRAQVVYDRIDIFLSRKYVLFVFLCGNELDFLEYRWAKKESSYYVHDFHKVHKSPNHLKLAMTHLMTILKSPKILIQELNFPFNFAWKQKDSWNTKRRNWHYHAKRTFFSAFVDAFSGFPHKLRVERLEVHFEMRPRDMVSVLQLLQPGTLKDIVLCSQNTKQNMDKVVEMEQWKMAKRMVLGQNEVVPLARFSHFQHSLIHCGRATIDELDEVIKNILRQGDKFDAFQVGTIYYDYEQFQRYLQRFELRDPEFPELRMIRIPNSDEHIRIAADEDTLFIFNGHRDRFVFNDNFRFVKDSDESE